LRVPIAIRAFYESYLWILQTLLLTHPDLHPGLLGTTPSKKRVQRICRAISDETGRDKVWQDSKTVVDRLNRMMIGWANYFCLGPVSKAYSAVDMHARWRLRRWLCDKHKEPRPAYKRFPEASLNSVYGLVQLPHRTANLPWAKA
jgi:hypothetical protein